MKALVARKLFSFFRLHITKPFSDSEKIRNQILKTAVITFRRTGDDPYQGRNQKNTMLASRYNAFFIILNRFLGIRIVTSGNPLCPLLHPEHAPHFHKMSGIGADVFIRS